MQVLMVGGPMDGRLGTLPNDQLPQRVTDPSWEGTYVLTTLSERVKVFIYKTSRPDRRWLPRKRAGGFPTTT